MKKILSLLVLFLFASACSTTQNLSLDEKFGHIYGKQFIVLQDLAVIEGNGDKYFIQKIPKDGFLKNYLKQYREDPEYWSLLDGGMTDSMMMGGLLGVLEKGTHFTVCSLKLIDVPWVCRSVEMFIKVRDPKFSPYQVNAASLIVTMAGQPQLDPNYVKKIEEPIQQ